MMNFVRQKYKCLQYSRETNKTESTETAYVYTPTLYTFALDAVFENSFAFSSAACEFLTSIFL